MRCEEAENHIAEYLRGTLVSESELMEHLSQCSRCRSDLDQLVEVWANLDDLPVPSTSAVMQAGLLQAIAEARVAPKQPLVQTRRKPMLPLIKTTLLVVLSAGAAFFLGHSLIEPTREMTSAYQPSATSENEGHYRGPA